MPLSLADFASRWKINALSERSGSQSHFIDLCEMLGQPHPAAADAVGERFTFEKPVSKVYGGKGSADVWLRDHFAWEYKGKHKDLKAAYKQLNDYREELGNPPLLVVCDMDRFEVHTNFTATKKRVYAFNLDDLKLNHVTATCPLPPLEVLRGLFGDYNVLRPDRTDAYVTQEAAKRFARLAERLEIEHRAHTDTPEATREQIAHFLMRLLFCLFADSVGLLPDRVFRRLVEIDRFYPRRFLKKLPLLFAAMSEPDGIFGEHTIRWFNGGLFDPNDSTVIQLDKADMGILFEVAHSYDWSHVAPAIFGTLFERSLDPARRSLIGAHYTSEEDILLLIEPVVMRPLRERWEALRAHILETLEIEKQQAETSGASRRSLLRSSPQAEQLLASWFDELSSVRILDPACGSGNFLYVALRRLLDLWKEARDFAGEHNIQLAMNYAVEKMVSPSQLFGIEIEFYAHELASIVVWIGFLQWKHEHGVLEDREPILQKLDNIEHADAILRYDAEGKPYEPQWPRTNYIIGNPPFLGDKLMRRELNALSHPRYVDQLRALYEGRVPGGADLVAYWFEKAREAIQIGYSNRAGLLATQGIRGGLNRIVLERIKSSGDIFWAQSDRNWMLDGAYVHVSMVAFDSGAETERELDGIKVQEIHPNLTSGTDSTSARELSENDDLCFIGTQKGGPFNISTEVAQKMLRAPVNPNGKPNSAVVHPWANAYDLTHRSRKMFVVDFGTDMSSEDAALFELPFEYVRKHVLPKRAELRRANHRDRWWIHGEARPGFRRRLNGKMRFLATARHAKHRFFVWLDPSVVPDSALAVIPRDDDYFFGVLSSSAHEAWSRAQGTQVREVESGFRYTPKSCFDTFPFPWPPGEEPAESEDPRVANIAEAARELVRLRDAWLNPLGASDDDLKSRTLTKLYNSRPEWLDSAHRALDKAVFAAYGWPAELSTSEILARLLLLNHERAAAERPAVIKKSRNRAIKPVVEEASQ